jgi:hypothetical protein
MTNGDMALLYVGAGMALAMNGTVRLAVRSRVLPAAWPLVRTARPHNLSR